MSLRARIILSFLVLFGAAYYLIIDSVIDDMRPRYLEAVEESLVDTANTLASLMETQVRNGRIDVAMAEVIFRNALERRFSAKIFAYTKTRVGLHAYITDDKGIVLFDSRGGGNVGGDFSHWNDVARTLKGTYGARSTRTDEKDSSSSQLHVAAPIMHRGRIIGVVTVIKPQDSVTPFIEIAQRKLLTAGLFSAAAFIALSVILTFWLSRPLTRLGRYVRSLRSDESARLPSLGTREIRGLGEEFASLWEELKGKKYIEEYIHALTHELKSPLSSIRGSAELLEEELPEEQRKAFIRTILREGRRLENIIQRMLELSSLENRRDLREVETVGVRALADEIIGDLAPALGRKHVTVRNLVQPNVVIRGEQFLLRHAMANLVENALRFSSGEGEVRIKAREGKDTLIISVEDDGPGVPDFALEKIFDRFYSLPDPDTGGKSTGLGLPFVREAAALHGGSAEVRNRPGGGAEAVLSLPTKVPM